MKKLCAIILLFSYTICFAQEKAHVRHTYDEPKDSRNLSLFATYGYDMSTNALPIGATLFYTGKYLSAEVNQSVSNLFKLSSDTIKKYNIKPFNNTELTFAFHIFQKEKTVSKRLVLNSWVIGNTRYEKYTHISVKARRIYGVRGGVDMFNSCMEVAMINRRSQDINYYSNILFLGLLSKRIINTKFDHPRKGSFKYMREFYFDFLLPVSTNADKPALPLSTGNDVSKYVNRPIGWRIGWTTHSTKIFGLYLRADAGSMPGYQLMAEGNSSKSIFSSMYVMFSIGLGFSSGILKHSPI